MVDVGLSHYMILSSMLFTIGLGGIFFNLHNLIMILVSIEIMLVATSINFVAFGHYLNNLEGQIFTIFILTVAAAETAIGLAILVIYFRKHHSVNVDTASELKG